MIIYLFVFSISIYFTWLAERSTKNKPIFFLLSSIAILTLSVLAGCRDSGIGTDTEVYVNKIWSKIIDINSWNDFIFYYQQKYFEDIEFIYLLLNWITSLFSKDVHSIYFITNLVVVVFTYLTLYDNRKKASMWIGMTFFCFIYYNLSLNLVRQSIALSMCMYSFKYWQRKQWIKAIIWFIIILNTHNTGIFYSIVIVTFFLTQIQNNKVKNILLSSFIIINLIIFIAFDFILILVIKLGILPTKFLWYLGSENEMLFIKSVFINYLIFLFSFFFMSKENNNINDKNNLKTFTLYKLLGCLFFVTSIISQWSYRISYYINYLTDCSFLPQALKISSKNSKKYYQIYLLSCISISIIVWYWSIVVHNGNETIPYKSKILGI